MSNGEKGRAEGRIERFSIVYINFLSLSHSLLRDQIERETLGLKELYVQAVSWSGIFLLEKKGIVCVEIQNNIQ